MGSSDPQDILGVFRETLRKAGYFLADDSRENMRIALKQVLKDFKSHPKSWQDEVSKKHIDWRGSNA